MQVISLLWTWNRTLDRAPYFLIGAFLFFVKFAIDWTIATFAFNVPWSPLNYLIWPDDRVVRVLEMGDPERSVSLTLLLVSLPFIWTGVILSLHRLRAAGLPLILIVFFFVPMVNLLLFLVLMCMPTREISESQETQRLADSASQPRSDQATGITAKAPRMRGRFEPLRDVHRSIVLESHWRSGLIALLITVPAAVLAVVFGAEVLQSYGFSLFVGAPFSVGLISVLVFGFSHRQTFGACLLVAFLSALVAGFAILLFALEGAICLIMAAPIGFFLVFMGALVGYTIQSRPWLSDQAPALMFALILTMPALMAAESANEPDAEIRAVHTEVIVAASPDKVWPLVIAFPPMAEPDDWFFRTGVAYPQRAEIHGTGVGAIRHCVFSTGTFVEPIDVWEEPTQLRFRVSEQPEPMEEWSPYHIHPAHLNHYLCSVKGQFQLEAMADGRTRLIGTTWYSNRMWPAPYWNLWSDYIIHRIHGRVLNHIRDLAEQR